MDGQHLCSCPLSSRSRAGDRPSCKPHKHQVGSWKARAVARPLPSYPTAATVSPDLDLTQVQSRRLDLEDLPGGHRRSGTTSLHPSQTRAGKGATDEELRPAEGVTSPRPQFPGCPSLVAYGSDGPGSESRLPRHGNGPGLRAWTGSLLLLLPWPPPSTPPTPGSPQVPSGPQHPQQGLSCDSPPALLLEQP